MLCPFSSGRSPRNYNKGAFKNMGLAHLQLSAFDQATGDFNKALAPDPNDAALHYDLGLADKSLDRVDDAIARV